MNGFRDGNDKPKCIICSKEIMAGKRCIECFMSKKKKRPEVTELPPSTVYSSSIHDLSIENEPFDIIYNTTATAHTLTATDTVENGQRTRRYKVNYPSLDYGSTQEGEKI